ncbi:ABC transporter ATP-binding protein [Urechidicola vernalis]|uniref:ABC transporter ATP-binding protein n=1 Tax=Urechidicola vernalis TaxID=3075600 RepID=A0ABU2Y6R2_9FLAO|nr:ABC transporter ATP-binding protein [Urechidicola sp. P050]MDT0553893.1 ABC transporter ATP-binding protein [Urechidicola sp. P050]
MKALRQLNKYFIKYKYRFLAGVIICIASNILKLQIPDFIKHSVDAFDAYAKGTIADKSVVYETNLKYFLLILGATLLSGILTFFTRQMIIVTSRLVEFDLKNEIYQQYQLLSLNFYKKNRTGDLMNRISEDVGKVRMYFGPAIMYSLNTVVAIIVIMVLMIQTDPILTAYTLLPLPILSISIYYLSRLIHKKTTIVQEYLSKLTTAAQESFAGVRIIKAYTTELDAINKFELVAEKSKQKNIELFKIQALFFPLMILLIGIGNLVVIYVGGLRYIEGYITLGDVTKFIMYVNILTWPMAVIGWVSNIIQQADASQARINEFLDVKPEIKNTISTQTPIDGNITFKNVTFTYDDTNITALKNISFELEKGKTLAILGKTGSGKSTIINMITRLYDIDKGMISIGNTAIKDLNLDNLRQSIGYVPQDAFLFSDSIENNIKFGAKNAGKSEIKQAAKDAYIDHNIVEFTEGYKTLVGERGVTLSGGQKQRVSIARALIKNPEILILDDCLSAVDTETEEIILKNLERITKNKTTIIISHRISSIKHADSILVLDEGKILQKGTHEQLSSVEGFYKELYEQQLLEDAS